MNIVFILQGNKDSFYPRPAAYGSEDSLYPHGNEDSFILHGIEYSFHSPAYSGSEDTSYHPRQ